MLIVLVSTYITISVCNGQKRIPYELKQFTIADGLPDNTVYGCLQDSEGYMWFFTPSGASRFNGRTFENYTINEGLADNEVLNGYEDSQKRIWFYSFNGKLAYFNLRTNRVERVKDKFNYTPVKSIIKSIIEDKNKNIWICHENSQIEIIDTNKISIDEGFAQYCVRENVSGANTTLYKGQNNDINILGSNCWTSLTLKNGININKSKKFSFYRNNIFVTDSSNIYFIAPIGIMKWDGVQLDVILNSKRYEGKTVQSINLINGKLWIGTNEDIFNYDLKTKYISNSFYTGTPVNRIFRDNENNYWAATLGQGTLLLPPSFEKTSIKNKNSGLEHNQVASITFNPSTNAIAFVVAPNLIYNVNLSLNNENSLFKTKVVRSDYINITQILAFNNDLYFIVKQPRAHIIKDYFLNQPQLLKLSPPDLHDSGDSLPLISHKITDYHRILSRGATYKKLYTPNKEVIYFTFIGIIKVLFEYNTFKSFDLRMIRSSERKADNNRIYAITEDSRGRVWFGGTVGIGCNDPSVDTMFSYMPHLHFESTINDMCSIENDVIVVSTTGSGLYLIKDNQIVRHIRELDGLPSNNCNRLFKQDEKRVWLGTNKGACLLEFRDSSYLSYDITIYGGKNTHPATYVNDLLVVHDTLYLATNDGLYSFGIKALTPQYHRPILKMLAPSSFVMNPSQKMSLPYGFFDSENQINFVFDGIAFLNGDIMTYQYRLFRNNTLIQSDTISLKDKLSLPFSSLTSGNYRLEVSCKRSDGVESEMSVSEFRVYSPIWRSLYATLVYIIIGGWIVFRILINTTRRNQERERAMIEQQSERNKLESMALEARQQLLSLEQESLRARIDPHFIFNCLNGLMSFVYEKDYESIKLMLPKLAKLIRSSLQLARRDFIGVEEEVVYLEDYLHLEKMRFEDRFDYGIRVGLGIDATVAIIPPLMLQIFVENSIKHGFRDKKRGEKGYIDISFFIEGGYIECEVKDNGIGIRESMSRKTEGAVHISLGLETVRKRIEVLNEIHGIHYAISFMDRQDIEGGDCSGTIVRLSIPVGGYSQG